MRQVLPVVPAKHNPHYLIFKSGKSFMIEVEILLTFVYFLECTVVQCKDALSIYWHRNGHECSRIWKLSANFTLIQCIKIVSSFLGRNISGTTWLLAFISGSSSRLLRLRFSADLTMHWFPMCHFRCMKFKPLVIWFWNQNIAISTIVGTSSHITNKNNEWQNECMQFTSSRSWLIALMQDRVERMSKIPDMKTAYAGY